MSHDFDPFLDGDESSSDWLSRHEPPSTRHQDDDEFMMDLEPTPPPSHIPSSQLMASVEHSNSQLSLLSQESEEAKSRSPFGTISNAPNTTTKRESSDDLYAVDSPPRTTPKATINGNHRDAPRNIAPTATGFSHDMQTPSPSSMNGSPNGNRINGTTSNDKKTQQSPGPSTCSADDELTAQQAALHIDTDDGDDFTIIAADRASPEAQRKWGLQQTHARKAELADGAILVKEEPKDEVRTPDVPPVAKKPAGKTVKDFNKIMAAQRALLKTMQSNGNGSGKSLFGGSRTLHPYQNQAESSNSHGARSHFNYTSPTPNGNFREDPSQVDAAMRDSDEDHSWMNDESEADDEYENLKALYDSLVKKEERGKITPSERLELFKVQKTLQMKERLRAAALQRDAAVEEEEEGLFVPESREDVVNRHRRNRPCPNDASEGEDDENANFEMEEDDEATFHKMLQQELNGDGLDGPGEPELTKSGKPRKKRAKAPKNAREFHQRGEEARREKERKKAQKQKQKARGGNNASSSRRKAPAASKGKGKGTRKATKGKKHGTVKNGESLLRSGHYSRYNGNDEVGQRMLEDLMANDPISDRLQNPIFNVEPEAPMPGQHNKVTQFQQLFANIPTGDGSKANLKSVKNDKKALKDASRSFGYARVKAQDGKWMIKGMTNTLYHHQLLGAQWMVQRELSSQPPHGGLLADSMGLGKTVQTLACMVGNPPGPEDIKRKVKTTLIVVPATVIDQWLDEIRVHAKRETFPKIMRYKSSAHIPIEVLEDLDIVVTSYSEVMKQFPFPDKEGREKIARIGYKNWWKTAMHDLGDLHQINWYRVVLDEAQAIKNNSARTSLACQNLKSVYRWCLTGTPLLNRLEELFPYLRFLKANYSMDWQTFQKYFCDPNAADCYNRIGTLLSYTMMRRTMKTTILNRPIVTLPPPHPEIQYIQFSPEEQMIYRITENRFRANLNAFFLQGEACRNYSVFMVQLLRLRQCTSHPFMLERTIKESWTLEDVAELKSRLARLKATSTSKPFYEQCQLWVEQSEKRRKAARERGEEEDVMLPFGQGSFGHAFSMDKALKTLSEKELFQRVVCSTCADIPDKAVKTDCGHIFCEECISTYIHRCASEGDDYMSCPSCDRVFQGVTPVRSPEDDGEDTDRDEHAPTPGKRRAYRETHKNTKGKDAMGFEPYTKYSSWLELSDNKPDSFPLTASAKTTALKALLLKGFTEAPFDKVVIYVQFRTLARIVGRICHSEGWDFLYLTGDRSLEDRSKVIAKFRDDKNIKILIAGLKCGGLGLNFPWANRCISLDLWWNHAVEQQAFGRIFRIGQKKETYMTRIVVKNTVDMRLLTMQLHKLTNLEKAMRDGEGKEAPNLSLNQLANLFGFLKTDADGEILSVEADYDDVGGGGEGESGREGSGEVMDESA